MNLNTYIRKITETFSPKKEMVTCTPPLARPSRDWMILLVCGALLFVISAVWASFTYLSTSSDFSAPSDTAQISGGGPMLDQTTLAHVLSLRDLRARAAGRSTQ